MKTAYIIKCLLLFLFFWQWQYILLFTALHLFICLFVYTVMFKLIFKILEFCNRKLNVFSVQIKHGLKLMNIIWQNTDLRHKWTDQFKPTMCKAHSIDPNNVMPMHLSVPEMLWKVNWTWCWKVENKRPGDIFGLLAMSANTPASTQHQTHTSWGSDR